MKKAPIGDAKRAEGAGTRERILDATLALFNDRGPDRGTTAEIARTVGSTTSKRRKRFSWRCSKDWRLTQLPL